MKLIVSGFASWAFGVCSQPWVISPVTQAQVLLSACNESVAAWSEKLIYTPDARGQKVGRLRASSGRAGTHFVTIYTINDIRLGFS